MKGFIQTTCHPMVFIKALEHLEAILSFWQLKAKEKKATDDMPTKSALLALMHTRHSPMSISGKWSNRRTFCTALVTMLVGSMMCRNKLPVTVPFKYIYIYILVDYLAKY